MYFVPGTLEPPVFYYFLHHKILPKEQRITEIVPWCLQRLDSVLQMLENELRDKEYMVGNRFSTVDIMLASTLAWTPDFLSPYSALHRYVQFHTERPAFQAAIVN